MKIVRGPQTSVRRFDALVMGDVFVDAAGSVYLKISPNAVFDLARNQVGNYCGGPDVRLCADAALVLEGYKEGCP